jgi:hypothetical protein
MSTFTEWLDARIEHATQAAVSVALQELNAKLDALPEEVEKRVTNTFAEATMDADDVAEKVIRHIKDSLPFGRILGGSG